MCNTGAPAEAGINSSKHREDERVDPEDRAEHAQAEREKWRGGQRCIRPRVCTQLVRICRLRAGMRGQNNVLSTVLNLEKMCQTRWERTTGKMSAKSVAFDSGELLAMVRSTAEGRPAAIVTICFQVRLARPTKAKVVRPALFEVLYSLGKRHTPAGPDEPTGSSAHSHDTNIFVLTQRSST
jgi:hypothetical protein